jgi:hypothetical protein
VLRPAAPLKIACKDELEWEYTQDQLTREIHLQLESQSVLGGVYVAAAAFAVRISCCLWLSATFLVSCGRQPVHLGLDGPNRHFTSSTNDLRQRAMWGLFLGLACSGRDEVAILILLQLRAGDHLSAEGSVFP